MVGGLQKEASMTVCLYCKGKMEHKTAPFSMDRKGYHISWDAVPAWVCTQCGEAYFESAEVDRIQKALEMLDRESVALSAVGESTPSN